MACVRKSLALRGDRLPGGRGLAPFQCTSGVKKFNELLVETLLCDAKCSQDKRNLTGYKSAAANDGNNGAYAWLRIGY